MTRKRRRHYTVVLVGIGPPRIVAVLVLGGFDDNLVFFYSPTDFKTKAEPLERQLRIGGLVEEHSVERARHGETVAFQAIDCAKAMPVTHSSGLHDLFRNRWAGSFRGYYAAR